MTRRTGELESRILQAIRSEDYQPKDERALAKALRIARGEYGNFREAVKSLMRAGRLVLGAQGTLLPPEMAGRVIGRYRANPRGFGFVIPESPGIHSDLYIPPGEALDAVTGDIVLARVRKRGKRGGKMLYEGSIERIIERGSSRFAGELRQQNGRWLVFPDGNILHTPIEVKDVGAKNARAGDQVVVEILEYPAAGRLARGVVIEVLGPRGAPGVDTLSIIRQYNLPDEFPEEVLAEARRKAREFDPDNLPPDRETLFDRTIITIDPADARDFDDAISLKAFRNGTWELGVHIADVAWFVAEGSALDTEAARRGNSVYLPDRVIPMLPEILSNGVCSLQEGEVRLTKSVFIRYDRKGHVLGARLANTAIRSTCRLTYEQASAALEGNTGDLPPRVVRLLRQMEQLARVIQQRRLRDGMIVLNIPEVEVVFDEEGHVSGVVPEDTSFSHTIIEMFMVEANEAVCRALVEAEVPHLRRIHPEPDPQAVQRCADFLRALGYPPPRSMTQPELQKVLKLAAGKPEEFAVNLAILRSMQPAEYSPEWVGHFALASRHYLHFTSPIRRYPDLTVHRLVDRLVRGRLKTPADRSRVPGVEELREIGQHCTYTENRAEDAERELTQVLILRLLDKRIGDQFRGIVTGVANFGLFVQLDEFLIDGLIRFDDLPDDWYDVNSKAGSVVGERTGLRIGIGDIVEVQIIAVDIPARRLDLQLMRIVQTRHGVRTDRRPTGESRGAAARRAATTPRRKGTTGRRKRTAGAKGTPRRRSAARRRPGPRA